MSPSATYEDELLEEAPEAEEVAEAPEEEEYQKPTKTYWAKEQDPTKLLRAIRDRCHTFFDFLQDTGLADRIERSHQMYYSLMVDGSGGSSAVKIAGEEGEIRIAEVNVYRSALQLLQTYITEHLPEWDAIATSEDSQTIEVAQEANQALDAIMDDVTKGCSQAIIQAVEDAISLNGGYVWRLWDKRLGEPTQADIATGEMIAWTGDYKYVNPLIYDVCFDPTIRKFGEKRWLDVRVQENRFDLMAEFPQLAYKIECIKTDYDGDYARFEFRFGSDKAYTGEQQDNVWVHYTYHLPCAALEKGRFIRHLGWELILEDMDELPDDGIPVHRLVAADFQGTPFGFSPAFACQAPQELLNNVISAIATNQDALANVKIHKQGGDPINRAQLERGITVIETDGKITPLNLLQSSPELYQSIPMFTQMVREQAAISNAAAGQSKPSESGAARAFEEQRTQQGATSFLTRYDDFMCEIGTGILRGYARRLQPGQSMKLIGKPVDGARRALTLTPEKLEAVQRVAIAKGNPEMRTVAGRVRWAQAMMESGAIQSTKQEFVTTATTGDLTRLIQPEVFQLNKVHRESDSLRRGEGGHVADPTDNQELHIRTHAKDAVSPEALADPAIQQACAAAALEHSELWNQPWCAALQAALGYNPGPALGSMGPPTAAGPGGAKPQPGGAKPPGAGGPEPTEPKLTGGVPAAAAAKAEQNGNLANAA